MGCLIKLYVDMDILAEFSQINKVDELYKENYFKKLNPIDNVVEAVNLFLEDTEKDIEVFVLSSCLNSSYARQEKNEWLDYYLPKLDQQHRIFIDYGKDKSKVIGKIDKSCILFDDCINNLSGWKDNGGIAIQLIHPVNKLNQWRGSKLDYSLDPNIMYYTLKRMIIEQFILTRTFGYTESITVTQTMQDLIGNRNPKNARNMDE